MYYKHEPAETLRPEQSAKRLQAMNATLDVVRDEGLDAVTMKRVAAVSGVALGTLYRFFVTKDHLLAAAFLHWALPIHAEVFDHDIAPESARAELKQMFRRGTYVYRDHPNMLALLVYVFGSTDRQAAEETQKLRVFVNDAIGRLLGRPDPNAVAISEILQAVWIDALMATRRGVRTLDAGVEQLESAVELLYRPAAPVFSAPIPEKPTA